MFKTVAYILYCSAHSKLTDSQIKENIERIKKKIEIYEKSDSEGAENLDKNDQPTGMGPLKQQPSLDNHTQNFSLMNYESNSENFDNENDYSTIDISSIHWTDYLEIIVMVAVVIVVIKHIRKYLKIKKKKKPAKAPADLVFQIHGTIPMSPPPNNPTLAFTPVQMMLKDKTGGNSRGSCGSVYRIYEPPRYSMMLR